MTYTPLNVYSGYSFFKSAIKLEEFVSLAKSRGVKKLGLCDIDNMFAYPLFNKLCLKSNITPIFGLTFSFNEIDVAFFIKNEIGYLNLLKISNLKSKNKNLNLDEILKIQNIFEGLKIIIKSSSSLFSQIDDNSVKRLEEYKNKFNFIVGLELSDDHIHVDLVRQFLEEKFELIAFPSIRHIKKEQGVTLLLLEAIKNNRVLNKGEDESPDFHYLSDEEIEYFYEEKEINKIEEFLSDIDFTFINKRGHLANFSKETKSELSSKELLKNNLLQGLKDKNISLEDKNYRNRLNHEYLTICKLGYEDYFLIVQDYVKYAKSQNIIVGPGRGSACGSLVSYLLDITTVDPLKFNLLFERFLNPERNSMPDIDIDFQDIRRDQVVEYLENKYGYEKVSHVIAFQTIKAKQAIRDICRIYNYGTDFADAISKKIPNNYKTGDGNADYTLQDAYDNIDTLRNLINSAPDFKDIFESAQLIEGLPRQQTLHAAGIIISSEKLTETMPINYINDKEIVSQFEKDYLEEQGFLKFDLLGLSNLTSIALTFSYLGRNENFNDLLEKTPYEHPSIFKLINNDLLMGLFQIDASAGRLAIKTIKPNKFIEIVDSISLARPGPIKFIKNYTDRKNGLEKVNYISNDISDILKPTYGIIIYQEQIMLIARRFAGFTFAEADLFRRAISKKNKDSILKMSDKFIQGAIKLGHSEDIAKKIFSLILRFANYGFNLSHAVSYAMITSKMAYLKARFPLEFYSAILSMQYANNSLKINNYLSEIKKMRVKVFVPSINYSQNVFIPHNNGILFPISAISQITNDLINGILIERSENGLFKDFKDFCERMNIRSKITENQLSILIDAGAFDEFNTNRKALKQTIKEISNYLEITDSGRSTNLIKKFVFPEVNNEVIDDKIERIVNETNALGVPISDNFLNHVNIDEKLKSQISNIIDLKLNETTYILGTIKAIKTITIKNGKSANKLMAFVSLEDSTSDIDLTFFPDDYVKYNDLIVKNKVVLVKGKKEERADRVSFFIYEVKEIK